MRILSCASEDHGCCPALRRLVSVAVVFAVKSALANAPLLASTPSSPPPRAQSAVGEYPTSARAADASPGGKPALGGETRGEATAATSFAAVDTSRLDAAGKAFFDKVVNEEICPCDCPKSFGQCLKEGTKCQPAVLLAEWIIASLEGGTPGESLQEAITRELTGGFSSTPKNPDTKGLAAKGSKQAKVTIVEYADFECAHCKAAAPVLDELVKSHPEVRLIYKHYPLPFHAMARPAAIAFEAAGRQGRSWEMHAALFSTQDFLSDDLIKGHAKALGLDIPRFLKDLAAPELAKQVEASRAEGQALGIEFTPYFIVNGRPYFLSRTVEGFELRLHMEQARATSSCQ